MEIAINTASLEDLGRIQNLGRFYVYEMSRYCGFLKGRETPENGLFEGIDLSRYWSEPNRHPLLIRVDGELVGFVLVNKIGSAPDVDCNMGNFLLPLKNIKARASFAEEDLCTLEHGEWSNNSHSIKSLLTGYASIRPVPDYMRLAPFLRLNKAIATIGFTVKCGTWTNTASRVYQYNRRFLKEFFEASV